MVIRRNGDSYSHPWAVKLAFEGRWDEISAYFDTMPDPEKFDIATKFMRDHIVNKKVRFMLSLLNDGRFLYGADIGAGFGYHMRRFTELRGGICIQGVEPDGRYRRKYFGISSLSLAQGSFDFGYMINVLHHTADPIGLLREAKEKCRVVIVSEINKDNPLLSVYLKVRMPWEYHEVHLSAVDVLEMLHEAMPEHTIETHEMSLLGIPKVFNWFIARPKKVKN